MNPASDRREFLKTVSATAAAAVGMGSTGLSAPAAPSSQEKSPMLFRISLAEWSLHRTLRAGKLDNLGFPALAKSEFGIEAVEYVNQFFKDKAEDVAYLTELKSRSDDAGVANLLIMVDGEGNLGDSDDSRRQQAVENHYKWVTAAKFLGCHSIRVNAASDRSLTYDQQKELAIDGLRRLSQFGAEHEISVLVENHGGLSSHGAWLASVIAGVGLPKYCGTLPDFGNFNIGENAYQGQEGQEKYDRYQGVKELMPHAKAVSAKSHEFDAQGNEVHTDYFRMMQIVLDAGYRGFVGIEWEGSEPGEIEGIRLTKQLLERVGSELA